MFSYISVNFPVVSGGSALLFAASVVPTIYGLLSGGSALGLGNILNQSPYIDIY